MEGQIDFEHLVKKHGYVRARQLLKRSVLEQHQAHVEMKQDHQTHSFNDLRVREATKLSRTAGGVGTKSLVDKILETNRSTKSLEAALNNQSLHEISRIVGTHEMARVSRDYHLSDSRMQYALSNQFHELLLPNADLEDFPIELAETLFLQINHLKQLKCVRNRFRNILSPNLPQISINSFKYLQFIDFSMNRLVRLPDNFGDLTDLQILNLSNNSIAKLPASFSNLGSLHTLDLSGNSFSVLPEQFGFIDSLTSLNLSENLFSLFPYAVIRLRNIKKLTFNRNAVSSLAILPPLLQEKDMWMPTIDRRTGKNLWMNILTREKVSHIEHYDGEGLKKKKDLHIFHHSSDVRRYKQRKIYLSVCQVHEWEPDTDIVSGSTYYRNNVSGTTSWTLPEALNTFGNMKSIEELVINSNAIKLLPESFVKLTLLTKLCLNRNRLEELPNTIGNLKALRCLQLSNNELKLLPTSLCDCKELVELLLDDNHLLRLPENIGFLPKLEKLDISHNRLKTVPFSLGYCSTLNRFVAHENPLEDPPMEEFERGIANILWYLRNRYLIERHGKPPLVSFHNISINQEITILEQELTETIQTRVQSSVREGFLNLQLLGLKEIPQVILRNPHFRKVKLDFNPSLNLFSSGASGFPRELRRIHSLSIRGCRLAAIPDNISIFERLTTLSLEENLLEFLPEGFTELINIRSINLSKNRLYHLFEGISNLQHLQTLNLESNFLETVPRALGLLKELKVLILSKNRLIDFPEEICQLSSLRVLNLEKNQLISLPKNLSMMSLIDFRVGHNYLEVLDEEFFSRQLGKSIKFFSCVENNLLEIPESIIFIDNLCMVELDYNPYITPPPYLISEGLITIQNYFKIRQYRKRLLFQLMVDEDFDLSIESFTPVAHEVLEDGTGFLTPEDLASFDQAVDEYINGEFFKCPSTGEEIVASITKLREDRETELYLTIIRTFLSVVSKLVSTNDPRYPESSLYTSQRNWGKDAELCNVWVISLSALLRETKPNVYYPNGRSSIFQLISEALPPIAFPFTVDLLKDSIRLFVSPYGTIADTEEVTFGSCDCMDEFRNKPKRHNPCQKPAVVICKSCYVAEEADRRAAEEDELLEKFEELEDEIRVWILTEEGKTLLEKEVKRRKAILKEDVQLREEMILSQQLKLKKANDHIKIVTARKIAFEQGAAYENHGFHSIEEAITVLNKAEDEANAFNDRIELLREKVQEIKAQLELDWRTSCRHAISDLVEKYSFITYEAAVKSFRQKALDHNWNRHWDGDEGESYEKWKRKHLAQKQEVVNPDGSGSDDDDDEQQDEESDDGDLKPEFDWSETDKMEKYKIYLFNTYRRTRPFDIDFK